MQLAKLVYMPEESTPTMATQDNREAVAYLELSDHTDHYGRLFVAAPKLLKACQSLAEDCRMALSGEWDKGDEGFEASLELLVSVIREATEGAVTIPDKISSYTVRSSHGELAIDDAGYVTQCKADNTEATGGQHLESITRFDLVEWRKHWGNPETDIIDILDLGYWYGVPETCTIAFEPPDAQWRSEIAEILLERRAASEAKGGAI